MWRDSLTNPELEFLAESTLISIMPNFRKEQIQLISGTFGPFKPNKAIQVPLWLGVQFRENRKCKIIIPAFLELNYLNSIIEQEKESKGSLVQLPSYFFEIAQILFNKAEEDFVDLKEVRGLVEDLAATRSAKINQMLEQIKEDELSYKMDAFNEKEIEQIRLFLNTIFPMRLDIYSPQPSLDLIGKNDLFSNPLPSDQNNTH